MRTKKMASQKKHSKKIKKHKAATPKRKRRNTNYDPLLDSPVLEPLGYQGDEP